MLTQHNYRCANRDRDHSDCDLTGRKLGESGSTRQASEHAEALHWARVRFGTDLRWGVEDCRHVSGRLERDPIAANQPVIRVPTKLMARTRASARAYRKSDSIDALAVARAVPREPGLPVACHDDASRQCKLLIDRREDLVGQRTATINRLLWRIHELDPAHSPKTGALLREKHQAALDAWLATTPGLVAELARDELADIARLTDAIYALYKRITECAHVLAPGLIALTECGPLTAAKIVGETANGDRFKSEAAFARHAGVAPVPAWSGGTTGPLRSAKSGNRQLSSALHRIALTQIRLDCEGQTHYRKRLCSFSTKVAEFSSSWREDGGSAINMRIQLAQPDFDTPV